MSLFRRFLSRPFGWLIAVAGFLCLAVPLAWATLVCVPKTLFELMT
jgi:hypothetical protein